MCFGSGLSGVTADIAGDRSGLALTRQASSDRAERELLPFLTAWDPSDLPGGSVDPLGFDRGYGCLTDKLLPGLTNVAHLPRYFGLICAGALLGPDTIAPNRADVQARQDTILRLLRVPTHPDRSFRPIVIAPSDRS